MMLLTIECVGERLSLPASAIREIVSAEPISPQPHFPHYVLGVTRIRGETMSVVDLALLLGHEKPIERNERTCFVVVRTGGSNADEEIVALVTDRILHSEIVTPDQIKPLSLVGGHNDVPHITGLLQIAEGIAAHLDLETLFRNRELTTESIDDASNTGKSKFEVHEVATAPPTEKVLVIDVGKQKLVVPLHEVGRLVAPGPPVAEERGPWGAQVVRREDGSLFMGIDLAVALDLEKDCDQDAELVALAGYCSR